MNKYLAQFNGKSQIIEAPAQWPAVQAARKALRVPRSRHGLLSVVVVEIDGREIIHSTGSL